MWKFRCLVLAVFIACAVPAAAQWPYLAEEAANLPEGQYSLSIGVWGSDQQKEVHHDNGRLLGRPAGVYVAVPQVQGTLGVGSRAEVSFDYQFLFYRARRDNSARWESGDLRLWTKLGLLRGERQDLSLRFGVKLPNSSHLGTNEADFLAAGLYDLRLGEWLATANLGLGVLGNPALHRAQDDVLIWAAALRRRPDHDGLQGGLEAFGTSGPYGIDRSRQATTWAAVLGWRGGRWRADTALRYGIADARGWSWTAGVTYGN